ncbi:hypothetical protein DL93DRAFT_2160711, partial [Clavulina sp. PMI_390]
MAAMAMTALLTMFVRCVAHAPRVLDHQHPTQSSYPMAAAPPRVQRRFFMDCVLLPRHSPSSLSSSSPPVSPMQSSSSPAPLSSATTHSPRADHHSSLGRGHRLKKPTSRLSSAVIDMDDSENPPKRSRPTPKAPRRSSAAHESGRRASGSRSGPRIWCHQCHQSRDHIGTILCIPCGKSYCYACLKRRYDEEPTDADRPDWECPRCLNYCDCLKCINARRELGTSAPSAKPSAAVTAATPLTLPHHEPRVTRARGARKRTLTLKLPAQPLSDSSDEDEDDADADNSSDDRGEEDHGVSPIVESMAPVGVLDAIISPAL